ncbi:MAG: phytase [Pseudomonadales bacterium]|nr:phytase [Pseudomonadales bacterium]
MQSAVRLNFLAFFLPLLLPFSACSLDVPAPAPPDAKQVYATAETDPVRSRDDAADDPAIWINAQNPQASLVIGTDKQSGIEVYDLQGNRVQFIAAGLTNNVDLRPFPAGSQWSALAAASNRSANTISLFVVDSRGSLTWLRDSEIATGMVEVYGLCMFQNDAGMQVFVNGTDGSYQQWGLTMVPSGLSDEPVQFQAELLREFSVPSQPEGCVADDTQERLFLGVEEEGIRTLSARHDASTAMQSVMDIDGTILFADVEGMSLYESGDGGYLVVSSQGNYSYAVYDRLPPFAYRGSFVVVDRGDEQVDGTEETDGLTVTSVNLGADYPDGLVVIQDGANHLPRKNQNFKYVSWREIATALDL